jgi:hypothetical protein
LIQSNKILPLSDKLTKSVQAAIERKNKAVDTFVVSVTISSVITGIIILTQLIFSIGIFRHILFSNMVVSQHATRSEATSAILDEKYQVARLLLQSQERRDASTNVDSLVRLHLMSRSDFKLFNFGFKKDQP